MGYPADLCGVRGRLRYCGLRGGLGRVGEKSACRDPLAPKWGLGVPGSASVSLQGQQVLKEMLAKSSAKSPGRGVARPGTG